MARGALAFVCQSCGSAHAKWSGQCSACEAWNTLIEEQAAPPAGVSARRSAKGRPVKPPSVGIAVRTTVVPES